MKNVSILLPEAVLEAVRRVQAEMVLAGAEKKSQADIIAHAIEHYDFSGLIGGKSE
jgi:hypothetical protein